jgi:hypothetical protein
MAMPVLLYILYDGQDGESYATATILASTLTFVVDLLEAFWSYPGSTLDLSSQKLLKTFYIVSGDTNLFGPVGQFLGDFSPRAKSTKRLFVHILARTRFFNRCLENDFFLG